MDGHFASRRAASRVRRKGLEACVGEDDFGAEPSSVIEPRLVLSALPATNGSSKSFFGARESDGDDESESEREREREGSESVDGGRLIGRS